MVRPGMYVTGTIQLARVQTLTVPIAAVSVRDGFSYVFVLDANDVARQQRVTVGRLLSDAVEIRDGLDPAARIVATGAGFLRDGDTVHVNTPQANNATAAAALK